MRVFRCTEPDCPQPVILIEFETIDTPEGLLEIEQEAKDKAARHDERYHSD